MSIYDRSYDALPTGVFSVILDRGAAIEDINRWFSEKTGLSRGDALLASVTKDSRDELELWMHRCSALGTQDAPNFGPVRIAGSSYLMKFAGCDFSGDAVRLLCIAEAADELSALRSQSELARRRYDVLSRLTDTVLFDYDRESDRILTYGSLSSRIGASVSASEYPAVMKELGLLTAEDCDIFGGFIDDVRAGRTGNISVDFRFDSRNYVPTEIRTEPLRNKSGGCTEILGTIAPRKELAAGFRPAEQLALDPLTGVFTKDSLEGIILECIDTRSDDIHALIMFELDGCKQLNESRGHIFGDMVLKELSGIIGDRIGEQDTLGRYTGAVFCVFCRSIDSEEYPATLAETVKRSIDEKYTVRSAGFSVRCNYGIAVYKKDGSTSDELFRRADIAMYKSKSERAKPIKFI